MPLARIATCLSRLSDDDLAALMRSSEPTPGFSPGLLAYLEHLADWETLRRSDRHFQLREPDGALGEDEHGYALSTLARLVDRFTKEERSAVADVLWAVTEALGASPARRPN